MMDDDDEDDEDVEEEDALNEERDELEEDDVDVVCGLVIKNDCDCDAGVEAAAA